MKKRLIYLLVICSLFFVCTGFTYNENKQRIYDDAGILSSGEIEKLEGIYQKYSMEDEADYIFLTTNDSEGLSSREYAKKFYTSNGCGYNKENGDGNLLLIDMQNRRIEMITKGSCVENIGDGEVERIISDIKSMASDGDYAGVATLYAQETNMAIHDELLKEPKYLLPIAAIVALILPVIILIVLVNQNKSQMTATAFNYTKYKKINKRQDRYLRTVTTAHKKQKVETSGGSSDSDGFGGGGSSF